MELAPHTHTPPTLAKQPLVRRPCLVLSRLRLKISLFFTPPLLLFQWVTKYDSFLGLADNGKCRKCPVLKKKGF